MHRILTKIKAVLTIAGSIKRLFGKYVVKIAFLGQKRLFFITLDVKSTI